MYVILASHFINPNVKYFGQTFPKVDFFGFLNVSDTMIRSLFGINNLSDLLVNFVKYLIVNKEPSCNYVEW